MTTEVTTCDLCAGTAVVEPGEPHLCNPDLHEVPRYGQGRRPTARQVSYLLGHWYWLLRDSHESAKAPEPRTILMLLGVQCPDLYRWAAELRLTGVNFDGVFPATPQGEKLHRELFPVMEALLQTPAPYPRPGSEEVEEPWSRESDPKEEKGLIGDWKHGVLATIGIILLCLLIHFLGHRP